MKTEAQKDYTAEREGNTDYKNLIILLLQNASEKQLRRIYKFVKTYLG